MNQLGYQPVNLETMMGLRAEIQLTRTPTVNTEYITSSARSIISSLYPDEWIHLPGQDGTRGLTMYLAWEMNESFPLPPELAELIRKQREHHKKNGVPTDSGEGYGGMTVLSDYYPLDNANPTGPLPKK